MVTTESTKAYLCTETRHVVYRSSKIGQMVAEITHFFDFFKMAPSTILDLWNVYLDHSGRVLGGLYRCAKFGWNRLSSFDNMQVFLFCHCGLKMPIHTPKIGVLGEFDALNREPYQRNPERHILARGRVIWAIAHQNRNLVNLTTIPAYAYHKI